MLAAALLRARKIRSIRDRFDVAVMKFVCLEARFKGKIDRVRFRVPVMFGHDVSYALGKGAGVDRWVPQDRKVLPGVPNGNNVDFGLSIKVGHRSAPSDRIAATRTHYRRTQRNGLAEKGTPRFQGVPLLLRTAA
jgi:hypothetical protein